ncbi:MAG TPA: hypothetical protein EYP19_01650, partial [Desulfobacterales bacterium]|nr:hypothetical protein [Desulfobacterales bacterium]
MRSILALGVQAIMRPPRGSPLHGTLIRLHMSREWDLESSTGKKVITRGGRDMVENESKSERETTEALMQEERLFRPLPELVVNANINPLQYEEAVKKGTEDLEGFWEEAANELDWFRKWDKVLDRSEAPFYKWFVNGKTNIALNALDRHVKTHRKNKVAVIFESEEGVRARMTYYDLYRYTNMLANALTALGVTKGDRVTLYLPNIPHTA